jgi:hypothetical protein
MKRSEIKPGVVYAYREGRDDYDRLVPVVILSTEAYTAQNRHEPGTPLYRKEPPGTKKLQRRAFYPSTGMPMVWARYGSGTPEDLAKVTLEDFEATTSNFVDQDKGITFEVLSYLPYLVGEYEAEVEARKQRLAARDKLREERTAARRDKSNRGHAVAMTLDAVGVRAHSWSDGNITVSLDEGEKLAQVLRDAIGVK